jgi:hypothetical protein
MDKSVKNISRVIVFLLSPFLSIPFIIKGIMEKNKSSVYLLIGVVGFISLMYIPEPSNDRKHYYWLYEYYQNITLGDFIFDLQSKTDFLFYTLIYLAVKINLPLNILCFIVLFLTLNNYYSSFFLLSKKYNAGKLFALFIFLILFSFQIKGLFSGVRFYMAASFIVRAFAECLNSKNFLKGLPYLILGVFTHFSCAIFVPFYLLYNFFYNKDKLVLYIFLFSFSFMLIPKEFLADKLVSGLGLSGIYEKKVSGYLGEEDYLEESKQIGNFNNYLRLIFNSLWLYVAYYYFILYRKRQSELKNMLFLILSSTNIFFTSSGTYYRLMFVPIVFFIFLLLRDYSQGVNNKKIIYIVFILVSLNFFGNLYAWRNILSKSLVMLESLTGPTMLLKEDIQYHDIR